MKGGLCRVKDVQVTENQQNCGAPSGKKKDPLRSDSRDQIQRRSWGIQFGPRQLSRQYGEPMCPNLRILQMASKAHDGENWTRIIK